MDHPLLSSFLRFSIFSLKVLEIQPNLFTHWPGTILFHIQVEEMKVAPWFPTLWDPMDYTVHGILQARILEWITSLLQEIFPTQGSDPGLPHCRRILYQLSHKGSPRTLEWAACPFSSRSSRPRNQTGVSCFAGGVCRFRRP